MYTLLYPWLLLLLVLPFIISKVLPAYRESRPALRVPWFNRVATLLNESPVNKDSVAKPKLAYNILLAILWVLIVIALARPQYLEPPISQIMPTRDLLLVVDLSGSMETEDFVNAQGETVDRLTAVKTVLDDFLSRREGDRVGLIVFGSGAFVQVPFTQDLAACRLLLEETAVRMAGPRTAFGDAIGLGITLFKRSDVKDRVMIVLTDGNDTASKVPPGEAAKIAKDNEIIIHVVGIGDPVSTGEEKFDQEVLNFVAATTGGQYFHGSDREQLKNIYTKLDEIDTREVAVKTYRQRNDLFHWPLGAFMVLGIMFYGMTVVSLNGVQGVGDVE